MRRISLNARRAHDDIASGEVEVVLWHITHPDLDAPIRLSTDPTERLSLEPIRYGTRSTWMTDDGSPFLFVLVSAQIPDSKKDAPATAKLSIANLDNSVASVLRSFVDPATVNMAVVLAGSPDLVEMEELGLQLLSADGSGDEIQCSLSRDLLTANAWPGQRKTRSRTPGLFP